MTIKNIFNDMCEYYEKQKISNISILIVSKDREFELKRLLRSLDKSSKYCNEYLNVFLGIKKYL